MNETRISARCPRCGRLLDADAPDGLCPACLLAAGAAPMLDTVASEADTVLGPAPDRGTGPGSDGGPDTGSEARLESGTTLGPYRIGRELGRGGMGEVYEAEHVESGRRLALKVLRGRLHGAEDRARFLREGQLAASISHPHTVYIYGSEELGGRPVITMELLPGGTLKDVVADHGPMAPAAAASAVLDIIGGLDAAQAAGVLHRDIKPSNCFLDADGAVKVGDFGLSISTLARDVEAGADRGGFQGTPQFAPPEQLRGEPLDVRADIYAVGATLYYLLTGVPPFDEPDLRALMASVTRDDPVPPRVRRPDVPAALSTLVMRCLAKAPDDRPASYAALASALRPFGRADVTPAPLGLRTVAGLADLFLIAMPMNLVQSWGLSTARVGDRTTADVDPWTGVVMFVYYLLIEGLTGASIGKRLFGLRLATPGGRRSRFARAAVRATIYCTLNLSLAAVVLVMGERELETWLAAHPITALGFGGVSLAYMAGLFSTARRRNGHAAVHDLVSGTRVVARVPEFNRRRSPARAALEAMWDRTAGVPARCGPFEVLGVLGSDAEGRTLMGFDPVLRRRVWIRQVPVDAPPVAPARRDVNRITRLHWLAGRRTAGEGWDAFEAPEGAAFASRQVAQGWDEAKGWLADLTRELVEAERGGAAPRLALDRVWLRTDGHAVLLDFPAPGTAPHDAPASSGDTGVAPAAGDAGPAPTASDVGLTPAAFLASVSRLVRPGAVANDAADEVPRPWPLSATRLLDRWSRGEAGSPQAAARDAAAVVALPDRVSPWRRALPLVMASTPTAILLVGAFAVLPQFRSAMTPQRFETYRLLAALASPEGQVEAALDPAEREAIETYVAGRHRATLTDQALWSAAVAGGNLQQLRATATRLAEARPDVPADDVAAAETRIAPRLRAIHEEYGTSVAPRLGRSATAIPVILAALGLGLAFIGALVSAAIVPGGVLIRLIGYAVVRRDGAAIGRSRSVLRVLVAWSPALAWLASALAWPAARMIDSSFLPATLAVATVLVMAVGTVITAFDPGRGVSGRLTGTWIVPR